MYLFGRARPAPRTSSNRSRVEHRRAHLLIETLSSGLAHVGERLQHGPDDAPDLGRPISWQRAIVSRSRSASATAVLRVWAVRRSKERSAAEAAAAELYCQGDLGGGVCGKTGASAGEDEDGEGTARSIEQRRGSFLGAWTRAERLTGEGEKRRRRVGGWSSRGQTGVRV